MPQLYSFSKQNFWVHVLWIRKFTYYIVLYLLFLHSWQCVAKTVIVLLISYFLWYNHLQNKPWWAHVTRGMPYPEHLVLGTYTELSWNRISYRLEVDSNCWDHLWGWLKLSVALCAVSVSPSSTHRPISSATYTCNTCQQPCLVS